MPAEYNKTIYILDKERNYNLNMRSGSRVYNQCKLLTIIYNEFSVILKNNGRIVENDLKEVYSKYSEELNSTQLYTNSLYNSNCKIYYYISSLPFTRKGFNEKRIEITCIYCNEKYTPTLQNFEQKICFCLYVDRKISFLKETDEIYKNHNSEDKCIGNSTYFIKDIVNSPKGR